jgi:very-short-patch-repair endonuclease/tetratricopeptide (TPR) repeat protein
MSKKAELSKKILSLLTESHGLRVKQIASKTGESRSAVNNMLYGDLAGKVRQDSEYRWYATRSGQSTRSGTSRHSGSSTGSRTILAKLCRYYLDCLAQGDENGVTVFARSRGTKDYVELNELPGLESSGEHPFAVSGADRLLRSVSQSKGRQVMYIGYPCRLRKHRARSGWEGFFLDPVLLWTVSVQDGVPSLSDEAPVLNFSVLKSLCVAGNTNYLEESAQLAEELGIAELSEEPPDVDELVSRLRAIRPDWDWRELTEPHALGSKPPISAIAEEGIYNRAVLVATERSKYTLGLETELKHLMKLKEADYAGTALEYWLHGGSGEVTDPLEPSEEILEVVPMNAEQRGAVRRALTEPLSVITGPPGTGKSQVVTGILTNAIWAGRKALFASKNNKAVDVVHERVNGLAKSPTLVRLGSAEKSYALAEHMLALLSSAVSDDDESEYSTAVAAHEKMYAELRAINERYDEVMRARNAVDALDRQVEDFRKLLGEDFYRSSQHIDVEQAMDNLVNLRHELEQTVRSTQPVASRLFWPLIEKSRQKRAMRALGEIEGLFQALQLSSPSEVPIASIDDHIEGIEEAERRLELAATIQKHKVALETLQRLPSFEELARRSLVVSDRASSSAEFLWRQWVALQPSRLNPDSRRELGAYTTTLQAMLDTKGGDPQAARQIAGRYYKLFPKIVDLMPCWAVTSLSARGKVPFEKNFFDLLIVDEASQCDIASVLPLLYRAKRAVVIGDPMQLKHIAALTPEKDQRLQTTHGIPENYAAWNYTVNSVFNLAVTIADPSALTLLRDHHRSHADIIEFSNEFFYKGKLRVATSYDRLKSPRKEDPAVTWTEITGRVRRPTGGGAVNEVEAQAVVQEIKSLINTGYLGSIGAVTPFRAQANQIRRLVLQDNDLVEALIKADFLVDTVHRFQGDERDVMFFSPVVSEGVRKGAITFLRSNGNLFNVAITRARALLHVVGDRAAAGTSGVDYLSAFAEYAGKLTHDQSLRLEASVPVTQDYPTVAYPERVSDWERVFYRALFEAGIQPVPQYDVDQYCLDFAVFDGNRKLNIEVDGERYHKDWTGELCLRDRMRNQRMIELGWDVKRFWVYQIRDDMSGCVKWVKNWVANARAS